MNQKTVIYERFGGKGSLLSEIEGVLLPAMPKDTAIDIDGSSYSVLSYGLVIEGQEVKAVIDVK